MQNEGNLKSNSAGLGQGVRSVSRKKKKKWVLCPGWELLKEAIHRKKRPGVSKGEWERSGLLIEKDNGEWQLRGFVWAPADRGLGELRGRNYME